jgi:hypothetical protein
MIAKIAVGQVWKYGAGGGRYEMTVIDYVPGQLKCRAIYGNGEETDFSAITSDGWTTGAWTSWKLVEDPSGINCLHDCSNKK